MKNYRILLLALCSYSLSKASDDTPYLEAQAASRTSTNFYAYFPSSVSLHPQKEERAAGHQLKSSDPVYNALFGTQEAPYDLRSYDKITPYCLQLDEQGRPKLHHARPIQKACALEDANMHGVWYEASPTKPLMGFNLSVQLSLQAAARKQHADVAISQQRIKTVDFHQALLGRYVSFRALFNLVKLRTVVMPPNALLKEPEYTYIRSAKSHPADDHNLSITVVHPIKIMVSGNVLGYATQEPRVGDHITFSDNVTRTFCKGKDGKLCLK